MTLVIRVPRPQTNPNVGSLVTQIEKRIPYRINRGNNSNPDVRWRWGCPVCTFTCEAKEKEGCQGEADAHKCLAAWCAVPMTAERVTLLGRPHLAEPSKEDRERWNRLRERNRGRT